MSQQGSEQTADGGTVQMTPEDVREQFQAFIETMDEEGIDTDPFTALFTPRSRGELLYAFLGLTEPKSATEICEEHDISRSTFADHIDVLVASGVVETQGMTGNATIYVPNYAHPTTQCLMMASTVQRHGVTPQKLEEQFIGNPAEDDVEAQED